MSQEESFKPMNKKLAPRTNAASAPLVRAYPTSCGIETQERRQHRPFRFSSTALPKHKDTDILQHHCCSVRAWDDPGMRTATKHTTSPVRTLPKVLLIMELCISLMHSFGRQAFLNPKTLLTAFSMLENRYNFCLNNDFSLSCILGAFRVSCRTFHCTLSVIPRNELCL